MKRFNSVAVQTWLWWNGEALMAVLAMFIIAAVLVWVAA